MSGDAGEPVAGEGLAAAVVRLAAGHPDALGLIEVGERPMTLSWSGLLAAADRVAAVLLELGVQRGEHVAFQLPNWAECAVVSLAVLRIGAVVAPVMPVFGARESALVLARARARVLILPEVFRGRLHAEELAAVQAEAAARGLELALEHVLVVPAHDPRGELRAGARSGRSTVATLAPLPGVAWYDYDAAVAAAAPGPPRRVQADDVGQLLFTSGTTGEPKGVLHSHGTLAAATAMQAAQLGLTADDRIFVPSPLAHQTGFLYGLLLSWQIGAAAVVQPVWNADVALEQAFGRAGARFVQAATPFVMDLVAAVEAGAPAPGSLRIVVPTGAAVPRELAARAVDVLGTAVCGAFGTTETCLGTLAAPGDEPASAWGSDGRALPGIRLRVVDDTGRILPAGAEGHFELHSPTVFLGYLDRPDLTAEAFTADGWYRTGDLARIDAEGFLHLTGRVKDVVNRGGEKVPVVEIENLLFGHPSVGDVAIVAEPHPRLGERACAFVVAADGHPELSFEAMQQHLAAAGVSKYYWPERLVTVAALPRNAVGKIQKNVLRERAAALVAADAPANEEEPA